MFLWPRGAHITMGETSSIAETSATGWQRSLKAYTNRNVLQVLALGFASGLPLLLTFSTLSAWLATAGVRRAAIGAFALVGTPYAFKFLWSPLIDRLPAPLPLGRRRGWGVTIQIALIAATLSLGACNPKRNLARMGALALLVAFLSASQDVVIDAWRVEILAPELQGPGAGMIQTGYRIAMLVSGAGSLFIASRFGWFAAYATMAALLAVGILVFLFGPEPKPAAEPVRRSRSDGGGGLREWLATAVTGPFAEFMRRPLWLVILVFIVGYKLGEALAGVMATPLYVSLGFSLDEIAAVSKLVGFFATVAGALIGGVVTARFGILRSLMLCGVLQSVGNLFYVLQAVGGHRIVYLGTLRHRRKSNRRNGGLSPGELPLQLVLAGLHSDSVRAAFFTRGGWTHAGGLVGRRAGRQARLGAILSSDHGGDRAGLAAARLDRTARHNWV